ncbi:hypothetical protein FKM82_025396 [Ascaphus truei]
MRGSGTYRYSNPWDALYLAIMALSARLHRVSSAFPARPGSTHDRGSSGSTGSDRMSGPMGSISLHSILNHLSCSSLSLCAGVNSPTAESVTLGTHRSIDAIPSCPPPLEPPSEV